MNPTIEQSNIIDFTKSSRDNLMIRAYAGTGKTSTLTMIDAAQPSQPHLLVCFNKLIAEEARKRIRDTTNVLTFNSLGHRVWAQACGKRLTLNAKKINEIFKHIVDGSKSADRKDMWTMYDQVLEATNLSRAIGYIPDGHAAQAKRLCDWSHVSGLMDSRPVPGVKPLVDRVLALAIYQSHEGIIDFSDQVYMPALFGGTYPCYPLVMIDEYQDLSPVNHAMVAKLCKHSRQIGVGDEAQAIYGFRGAADHSIRDAVASFSMTIMPLSQSFRCPHAIVRNVHWRVPDFRTEIPGGTVETLVGDFDINSGTVICRNNAPLLRMAMQLLRGGHKVDVEGCDIGNRIVRIMEKLGDSDMSQRQALFAVDAWEETRVLAGSKSAADVAECMRIFIRSANDLSGAVTYACHLFAQAGGTIKFMTGHKSKGLEFDHVYHLDRHLLKGGQDRNLAYVIDTRSKDTLSYIQSR